MLRHLFPRLTRAPERGSALFDAVVAEARRPAWYREGAVPDSIDGRFAVLATLVAIATVRLERGGDVARGASIALAERFVETMDAEHREMGLGDPGLGRQVRKLVGSLAGRIDRWRPALDSGADLSSATLASLYRNAAPPPAALATSLDRIRSLWTRLEAASDEALAEGRLG